MKFLELNKKRHAIKHFTDQPVDPKDVRTAIEIATLAPSAHNSQPWKFVVVRQKNAELAKLAYGANYDQVMEAPVTIALFTDTDLQRRARKIARVGGVKNFTDEQLQYFMQNLPAEFAGFDKSKINEVLDIEERFRPELLITVGYAAEKVEPSYRLPVDEIIEKR